MNCNLIISQGSYISNFKKTQQYNIYIELNLPRWITLVNNLGSPLLDTREIVQKALYCSVCLREGSPPYSGVKESSPEVSGKFVPGRK